MPGFPPCAYSPLGDDGARLPDSFSMAVGSLSFGGDAYMSSAIASDVSGILAPDGADFAADDAHLKAGGVIASTCTASGAAAAQAINHQDFALTGDSAGSVIAEAAVQSALSNEGPANGFAFLQASASSGYALSPQADAGVPVEGLSRRAIDLSGSAVGRVANTAGITGTGDLDGLAASVANTDAAAQPVLGLEGHARGAVATRSQIDGGFDTVNIGDTSVSVSGKSTIEIAASGSAAAQAAVAVAIGAALAPAGAAHTALTISATAQSKSTVLPDAQVTTGNSGLAQASLVITGVIFGTSQSPMFAQAASEILIGGAAKLDAAVSGAAEAGTDLNLVDALNGRGGIAGGGVSAVDVALNFAGDAMLPASFASVVVSVLVKLVLRSIFCQP